MIQEAEKRAYNDLTADILNLEPGILSCVIISDPQGSVLARAAKPEFQHFGNLQGNTEGMAGHWALLAFNAMKRLDPARSKVKYISIGREDHKTLLSPVNFRGADLMIIMAVKFGNESTEIHNKIIKLLEGRA